MAFMYTFNRVIRIDDNESIIVAWDDSDQFLGIIGYEAGSAWDDSDQFLGIIGDL